MRAPGEIRELSEIIRPDIGVITNVGESHMELLGSRETSHEPSLNLLKSWEIPVLQC